MRSSPQKQRYYPFKCRLYPHAHAAVVSAEPPSLPFLLLNVCVSPLDTYLLLIQTCHTNTQLHTHTRTHTHWLAVSQRVTAGRWVTAALSVCCRRIFCCQQFCKVTLDCHCERGKGHLFTCLPPQTVNSFQRCLPSSIIECFWINDSLLYRSHNSAVLVCHWFDTVG